MRRHLILSILAFMLAALGAAPARSQLFDPVNDDTDLFMMNPNTAGVSPNILIVADNTANWSSVFLAEKTALAQVVGALTENVNIGLMLYGLTGGDVEAGFSASMADIPCTPSGRSVRMARRPPIARC